MTNNENLNEFTNLPPEIISNILEYVPLDDIPNLLEFSPIFEDTYLIRKKLKEIGYDTEEDITISEIRMIIRNRGKVYATGDNHYGQLGLESELRSDSEDTVGLPTVSSESELCSDSKPNCPNLLSPVA